VATGPDRKGHGVRDDPSDVTLLVAAAADGDQGAWGEIVDRYTPLLVSVLLRYRLSSGELQDVAQTVWLRLVEHLGDLREPRALPMWLITTAKREAVRAATVSRRVRPVDPQDSAWSSRMVAEDDPDADLERSERHAALLAGFAALSPRQRMLLTMLSEDPPVPYAEISRRTGIPVGAIGPTRARALERLRKTPAVQALASHVGAEPSRRRP
jgi:RNA polymerase sigma factor (sigma-70 family)